MTVETVKMLVAGQWLTSDSTRSSKVYNPSTGRVIAEVPLSSPGEVGRAASGHSSEHQATPRMIFVLAEDDECRLQEECPCKPHEVTL